MITIAQAVSDLIANPRPVLLLDTCTLLDIVRSPLRDRVETVRAVIELKAHMAAGTVRLFVQDTVPREWTENLPSARRDGEDGVWAFAATWQIAADLGLPAPPLPVLAPGALIDELEKLSRDLLTAADVLHRDFAGMSRAMDRVAGKRKPSSAKGMVKDSHILGHALQLSTLLVAAGFPNSRILVSSNKSDFAGLNAIVFHPDITADAAVAGLHYAGSLEAAVANLRAAGEIP